MAVPTPITSYVTRWRQDPWTQGSYAYIPVGASFDDMLALRDPVDGRLFFADEATDPDFFGTAHGAMRSGLRAAKAIEPCASL